MYEIPNYCAHQASTQAAQYSTSVQSSHQASTATMGVFSVVAGVSSTALAGAGVADAGLKDEDALGWALLKTYALGWALLKTDALGWASCVQH